ncbi:hypothetical protein MATL_G00157370 [Megalops atlanticus]|uniref:Uncharacterized protein n=1 Tax=Megalops atlanticus TaxID=7932 RepID=A0A9D3PQ04_MEGAT|nr:hypothetical protein MATL_G00157370 [Megalops atlanticus]
MHFARVSQKARRRHIIATTSWTSDCHSSQRKDWDQEAGWMQEGDVPYSLTDRWSQKQQSGWDTTMTSQ